MLGKLTAPIFTSFAFCASILTTHAPAATLASQAYAVANSPLSEAQIGRLLLLANTADNDEASEALDSAHNIRIQGYADDIIRDCEALRKDLETVIDHTSGSQESNESKVLSERYARDLELLHNSYGSTFEHVYLEQQMEAQYELIDLIDQKAAPAASSPELRQLLDKVRAAAVKHLLFAKQLRGDLEL